MVEHRERLTSEQTVSYSGLLAGKWWIKPLRFSRGLELTIMDGQARNWCTSLNLTISSEPLRVNELHFKDLRLIQSTLRLQVYSKQTTKPSWSSCEESIIFKRAGWCTWSKISTHPSRESTAYWDKPSVIADLLSIIQPREEGLDRVKRGEFKPPWKKTVKDTNQ